MIQYRRCMVSERFACWPILTSSHAWQLQHTLSWCMCRMLKPAWCCWWPLSPPLAPRLVWVCYCTGLEVVGFACYITSSSQANVLSTSLLNCLHYYSSGCAVSAAVHRSVSVDGPTLRLKLVYNICRMTCTCHQRVYMKAPSEEIYSILTICDLLLVRLSEMQFVCMKLSLVMNCLSICYRRIWTRSGRFGLRKHVKCDICWSHRW